MASFSLWPSGVLNGADGATILLSIEGSIYSNDSQQTEPCNDIWPYKSPMSNVPVDRSLG